MAYPILAPSNTWYKSSVLRSTITEINIVDTYTPTGSETETWNADVDNSGAIKCYRNGSIITIAGNGSGKIAMNADSSYLFSSSDTTNRFENTSVISGLALLDASSATTFNRLFNMCSSVLELDVSNWVTNNVTELNFAFSNCNKLSALNISNWNVSNVTTMENMFQAAYALQSLDLSNWNVGNVVSMRRMFIGPNDNDMQLTTIGDVSNWDVSNVTTMEHMFSCCAFLSSLNISNWNVNKVTNMKGMFYRCRSLSSLDLSNWKVGNVTNMSFMFQECTSLTTIGNVSNWKTGNVTNMNYMFDGCTNLETLDVTNWDVSKVQNMQAMFQTGSSHIGNGKLKNLDVSKWDTSSCEDMGWMFYGCGAQTYIDVSNWNVSKVKCFSHMFADNFKLQSLDVSKWTVESAESLDAIFNDCNSLTTIDVSNWRTAKNKEFSQMFESCDNLTTIIGLENFNTANGERFYEMFKNSVKLTSLNLSSFDTRKANDAYVAVNGDTGAAMKDMFGNMPALKSITLGENFDFDGNNCAIKAVLPTPVSNRIELADGKWYTEDGVSYAPTNIPNRTAGTYYAYNKYVADQDYLTKGETILKLVNAIKNKVGSSDALTIDQIINIIKNRLYLVATLCPLVNGSVTVNDTKLTISYGNHVKISGSGGSYSQVINISDIQMETVIGNLSEKYVVPAGSTLTMKFKNIVWDETAKASYSEVGSNFKKAGSNEGVLPMGKFFIYSNQPDVTEFSYSHTVNTDTSIGSLFIYINPLKGTVEFDVELFIDDAQYV